MITIRYEMFCACKAASQSQPNLPNGTIRKRIENKMV